LYQYDDVSVLSFIIFLLIDLTKRISIPVENEAIPKAISVNPSRKIGEVSQI
jgi:hypothetical protein